MKQAVQIVFVFLFLFSVSLNVFCQEPSLKSYDINAGLPSNECYRVIQDKKGYIWVASDAGLSRYNGYNFQNFTKKDGLPDNVILNIFEDAKGRIWIIGLNARIAYFENEVFYPLKELNRFLENNVKNAQISAAYINDKDELHLGFNLLYPYLITYSLPKKEITVQKKIEINNLYIKVGKGNDFIYGTYGVYSTYSSSEVHSGYTTNPALYLNIEQEGKKNIFIDIKSYGRSYIVNYLKLNNDSMLISMDKQLFLIDGHKIYKTIKFNSNILHLYKDHKNRIWVLSLNEGAYVFESAGRLNGASQHLFENCSFSSIIEDKENNYWLSSLKSGLCQIPNFDILHYPIKENDKNIRMNTVTKFHQTIYSAGFSKNIYTYTKEHNLTKGFDLPQKNVEVYDMQIRKNILIMAGSPSNIAWINNNKVNVKEIKGHKGGIIYLRYLDACITNNDNSILSGKAGSYSKINLNTAKAENWDFPAPSSINNLYTDTINKRIYYGCLDGLYYSSDSHLSYYKTVYPWLTNEINPFLKTISSFILSSEEMKLIFWNEKKPWIDDAYPAYSKITNKLLNTRINHITKKDNVFILSSKEKGLIFWDGKKAWNITKDDGLPSNVCKKALVDKRGNIWVATNKGISKVELKPNGTFEINNLTSHEGLTSDDIYNFSIIEDEIWIPTTSGLTKFNTNLQIKNTVPPPIYITGIAVDDSLYKVNSFAEIPYNHNYIKLNYNGLSYKSNGELMYEYRLIGLDSGWKQTKATQVEFTRLTSGEYAFEIRAIKNNHLKSSQAAVFNFVIYPPWYKTWWFIVLSISATVSIIYLFFWIRFKRLKAREEEKTKLITLVTETEIKALRAQTNPHFIFNALNSISLFVLKNDSDQAQYYLMRFAQLMRDVLENSEHDVISLGKEFSILKTYMELEVLRFGGKYTFDIIIPEELLNAHIIIPPLLLQPIIENAIWHGLMPLENRNGLLVLKAKKENHTVTITVEDNGIGRKKSAEIKAGKTSHKTSKGIFMTKNRIDLFNQKHTEKIKINTTDLFDENNNPIGTKVELLIENI